MILIPLKSKIIGAGDDLFAHICGSLKANKQVLKDGDILIITSKVVSYAEGRLKKATDREAMKQLVRKEADMVVDDGEMVITLKNHVLIPNAGIDNSNTPVGVAVLWPKDPFESARGVRAELLKKFSLKKLGVLISDSHCQPLRAGTSGIAIGWAGFEGVKDERGNPDLFGKKMQYTRVATGDNLASAAILLMGETNAAIPYVIARGYDAKFTGKKYSAKDYFIAPEECIYKSVFTDHFKKSMKDL